MRVARSDAKSAKQIRAPPLPPVFPRFPKDSARQPPFGCGPRIKAPHRRTQPGMPSATTMPPVPEAQPRRLPAQRVEAKFGRTRRVLIHAHFAITSVLKQFDSRHRRAEAHLKVAPASRFIQGLTHAPDRIAQKMNRGHPGQQPAFPKKQIGMQMSYDGMLKLRQFAPHGWVVP